MSQSPLAALTQQLAHLPPDLLRTLQRAANGLDLDVQGLTADEVVQRYTALGCQITPDFAARILRELPSAGTSHSDIAAAKLNESDLPIAGDKDDGSGSHQGSVEPALTLRFYDWRCGHHGQRPADIPVSNPEQASAILHAMSHCISQPGHFRAWLMNDVHAVGAYVSDDHFSLANSEKTQFPNTELLGWDDERPVLIYGTAEQIAELNSPAHAEAVSGLWFWDSLPAWDGKSYLDESMATTTLTLAELQELARPIEWHEPARGEWFGLPPVFKSAATALEEVRAISAELAATVQTPALDA
ncbi:hypothetical protein [Comamonas terrae]|uniref:Uncharacterized protein n=1 Tax=Comamonas terrae TaxID=673548 RepID=A0ABW5UKX0_9BURK|nr:hypothetical protein [Comamonas terrae]